MCSTIDRVMGMRWIIASKGDEGAAAVEFALVLPILVLLLFGIIQFGIVYDAQLTITHAAREGARMAAVGGDVAAAVAAQTVGLDQSKVTLVPTQLKGSASDPRGYYYEVTVKYAYPLDIPLWDELTLDLQSTAQMRRES